MFLDTAQQRDSVVSHAKLLGYLPTSAIGASANVQLTFTGVANTTSQFTIPKNSQFVTTIDDVQYTYVTPEAYTVKNTANTFTLPITIKEGIPLTQRFTVDFSNPQRYIIPNKNVDTSSISVRIQNSASDDTVVEYTRATDLETITSTSTIYFIEEAVDGRYELVFGSGSLGKALKNGNIIIIDYLVNSADVTNGATNFTVDDLSGITESYDSVTITLNKKSSGGRGQESVESIKFNAPRNFQTQNRAVVDNDYVRILLNENADLQSVTAYGGEFADPAVYGKVFIAVKPFGEQFATETRKQSLRESILSRTPLSIDPVFIDPEYTYVLTNITTYYDKSATTETTGAIELAVRSAIDSFSASNLERFGNRLRYSRFVRALDNIPTGSIFNNDASLTLQKRVVPNLQRPEKVTLSFNNPIEVSSLSSTEFTYLNFTCRIDDDGVGNVRIFRFNAAKEKVIIERATGTINYTTGLVTVENFQPSAYDGIELKFNVTPSRLDIIPVREQILIMTSNDATINLVGETD